MSDVGLSVFGLWDSRLLRNLSRDCVVLTLLLVVCTKAGNPPGSHQDPSPDSEPNDDDDEESFLESLDTKMLLLFIVLLLVVIIIVVVVIACWRRLTLERRSVSAPRGLFCPHVHHTAACCTCRAGRAPECSVHTIYNPRQCCGPSLQASCHRCGSLPGNAGVIPPPAYQYHSQSNPCVSERAEPRSDGQLSSRLVDQSTDTDRRRDALTRASPVEVTDRTAIVPVGSCVRTDVSRRNEVTDDHDQTAVVSSLTSSGTSNQSGSGAFFSRFDDCVMLRPNPASASPADWNPDPDTNSSHGPLNIECPGLFETFPPCLRDLYVPGQRSDRRTVAGKLVVSLARQVDSKGDFLVLDNMGISLQIPPGAIPDGQRQLVSVVLNWDLEDNPPMDNRQALVSPVVYCGPHGLVLHKPCVLSFKHCAFDPRMIQVMSSQTELVDQKDWQVMCSAEDESGLVALTTDECQVRLQHFSLFTCIQTPPPGASTKKWLQVAAFCAPLQHQVHHYQVRVYFLNKTPCALQWAIQNEARFGFRLACPERTVLFHGTGEDLHLSVDYVSHGWQEIGEDGEVCREDTVTYHTVWHGKCPHLAFCFKRHCLAPPHPVLGSPPPGVRADASFSRQVPHASEINLEMKVFQDSQANCPDRLNLLLTEVPARSPTSDPPPSCTPTQVLPTCNSHPINITMPPVPVAHGQVRGNVCIDHGSSGPSVFVDFKPDPDCLAWPLFVDGVEEGGAGGLVYPQDLKLKLKLKMDPPDPFGRDWKLLASRVGLDDYIRWLMTVDDPTQHVLQFMEMKGMTLSCLMHHLIDMQRSDAAAVVQDAISRRQRGTSQQAETSLSYDYADRKSRREGRKGDVVGPGQRESYRRDEGQEHCDDTETTLTGLKGI